MLSPLVKIRARRNENQSAVGWGGGYSVLLGYASRAAAQTDEIQVYDAAIAAPGVFNLTWHNNFISSGSNTPGFPGAIVPDKSLNGVSEWA